MMGLEMFIEKLFLKILERYKIMELIAVGELLNCWYRWNLEPGAVWNKTERLETAQLLG